MTVLRKDVAVQDRWNVEALYPTLEAFTQALQEVNFDEIKQYRGRLSESSDTLLKALDAYFKTERALSKLYTYAHLRHDEDIAENSTKQAYEIISSLYHQFSQDTAWLSPELLHMPEEKFSKLLTDPKLKTYHFFLEKLYRLKAHTLPIEQEELLALADQALDTSPKAFSALNNADFHFGKIKDEQGNERDLTHASFGMYMRDRDRTLRKNAFQAMHGKYFEFRNSITELLGGQVQNHLFAARARKYSGCLESALYPRNVDLDVYHSLIKAVHNNIDALHSYVKLRKKLLGLDELHFYDLYVPLVPAYDMKMSYEEAENIVVEAVKPLGKEYVDALHNGLKTDRWVDRYENKNKRSGAYSSGCYDSMPYILMNFKGILRDVFTLMHEAGHSMHSYYSRKHQPYHYSNYTIFVAEVASTFNEELLTKTLLKRATSVQEKAFLINEKIEDIRTTLFRQVMFCEFELFIHEAAEKRIPITPDLLSEEFTRLNRFYFGETIVMDPEIAIEWARIPHFYYNFYVFQYATGISAALALANGVLNGGDKEREAYLQFLRSGCSDYPLELLKKAGVDMKSVKPVECAIGEFRSLVAELETLLTEAEVAN